MARRRHSRRTSKSRRRVNRNAKAILKNIFGANVMNDVVTPVLGGTVGFIAARYLGNMVSEKVPQLADPRYGKLAAAAVGIAATFAASGANPMIAKNSGPLVLGMGLAAAEAFLRNTPLLGGAPAAALLVATPPAAPHPPPEPPEPPPEPLPSETAAAGVGSYYSEGMLGLGRGYDTSHAGAPYQGMLGVGEYVDSLSGLGEDPASQEAADHAMNRMESVATITPTDLAVQARNMPAVRPVTTPFASGDKGYAGGMFARHLFAGMMGG
jgi:hypothetical protein